MPGAEQQISFPLGSKQALDAWGDCCELSPTTCQQLLCVDLSYTSSSCPGMSHGSAKFQQCWDQCAEPKVPPFILGCVDRAVPSWETPYLHLSPVVERDWEWKSRRAWGAKWGS